MPVRVESAAGGQLANYAEGPNAEYDFLRQGFSATSIGSLDRVPFAKVKFAAEMLEDVATADAGGLAPLAGGLVGEAAVVVLSALALRPFLSLLGGGI